MKVISCLLKVGADPNVTRKKYNDTALHWAAANGRAEVVKALLDAGADPHIVSLSGFIPLDLAHEFHKIEVCKLVHDSRHSPIKIALFHWLQVSCVNDLIQLISVSKVTIMQICRCYNLSSPVLQSA